MSEKRVTVGTFIGRTQADLAAAHLRASGIEAEVRADDAGGAIPPLQLASGAKVLVSESNEADAREILEEGGHFSDSESPTTSARANFWGWALVCFAALAVLWLVLQVLDSLQTG
jgi:hypothetical protein